MEPIRALRVAKELQLLHSDPSRTLYFHGESMRPFFREGDQLTVAPVHWDEIRLGDVIAYRSGDQFPARRVVRKLKAALQLWCDNWPDRRFEAARSDVLGRVVARDRRGSRLTFRQTAWKRAARRALLQFYAAALANKALRACARMRKKLGGRGTGSLPGF
jgi:Peptidase S24-like